MPLEYTIQSPYNLLLYFVFYTKCHSRDESSDVYLSTLFLFPSPLFLSLSLFTHTHTILLFHCIYQRRPTEILILDLELNSTLEPQKTITSDKIILNTRKIQSLVPALKWFSERDCKLYILKI